MPAYILHGSKLGGGGGGGLQRPPIFLSGHYVHNYVCARVYHPPCLSPADRKFALVSTTHCMQSISDVSNILYGSKFSRVQKTLHAAASLIS